MDFTVDLSAIRYQDDRVVPDENVADDEHRSRLDEFVGVVPSYGVITRLTDAISKDDYYVKSVIEHAPYRDDSRADVLNRVWDIAGRFYTGVFPIDFDIHVRGEEIQGASGVYAGKSAVQVTVKGSYATGGNADGRLRDRIENKWDDLHGKVVKVFSESAAMAYAAWAPTGADNPLEQPAAVAVGEVVEPAAIERGVDVEPLPPAEIVRSVTVPPSDIRADAQDKAERKADLRRQWEIADEAVMTGRVSENVYREHRRTRIKTELRDLGEDLGE